ncbi:MAG: pseudouridine synthase [Nitrospira sp. CR2.1]|nr:pseudouridine synthase [Nitrospira sp. CR2.1]
MEVRLQKLIAGTGLASRRKAEELITSGRVTINGSVVKELGTKVDPDRDHVKVDGKHLRAAQPYVYVILNKPKNVMSTLEDPEGRPTVKDFLRGVSVRVFPVGRLDFDSEGLMLLTNHGDLAQALLHPRYHVPKTYLIKVKGVLNDAEIGTLERGVKLEDGLTAPAKVQKISRAESNSWLEVTIHEGRKHQVKRMLEAVGHAVIKLTRVRMGPLLLGDLAAGEYRFLTDREANRLRELVGDRIARAERPELDASGKPMRWMPPTEPAPPRPPKPERTGRGPRSQRSELGGRTKPDRAGDTSSRPGAGGMKRPMSHGAKFRRKNTSNGAKRGPKQDVGAFEGRVSGEARSPQGERGGRPVRSGEKTKAPGRSAAQGRPGAGRSFQQNRRGTPSASRPGTRGPAKPSRQSTRRKA